MKETLVRHINSIATSPPASRCKGDPDAQPGVRFIARVPIELPRPESRRADRHLHRAASNNRR